ncbi:hypothetical protein AG1IA_10439 [Rhizoctonia solani AG-1 IA]|uniref:Uncharacterized protein n=1 Tax=Thanatephorus cucumeris (strain AG1-IA) TaxID=983506 RepID=L8WBH9_THACA|nr:hypothetical protein AG1IA_10439 [Rhizoctonia solani AG-1 IA]
MDIARPLGHGRIDEGVAQRKCEWLDRVVDSHDELASSGTCIERGECVTRVDSSRCGLFGTEGFGRRE